MLTYKKWIKKNYKNKSKKWIKKKENKLTYLYNKYSTKILGKNIKNNFVFNEIGHLDKNKSIFDFKNLLEETEKWKEFQNEHLLKDFKGNPLTGKALERGKKIIINNNRNLYLYGDWIRYFDKSFTEEIFYYGILISLYSYIFDKMDEYWNKLVNKKIPNLLYKPYNEPLFKKCEDNPKHSTMYDFETRAFGKEEELKKIKDFWNNKGSDLISDYITEIIKPYKNTTFRISNLKDKYDPTSWDIIGGKEAAEHIKFDNYLETLTELEQSNQIVKNLIKECKKYLKKEIFKKYDKTNI